MLSNLAVTLFALISSHMVFGENQDGCPDASDILPCSCEAKKISCNTDIDFDLKQLMKTLAETSTHWDTFELSSPVIRELGNTIFHGVTFKVVKLMYNTKLTCVRPRAFDGMEDTMEKFISYHTSLAHFEKPECSVCEAIKRLNLTRVVSIIGSEITRLPEDCFYRKSNKQNRLLYLDFSGQQGGLITGIGRNAFASLDNLKFLDLSMNKIATIANQAFYFEEQGSHRIEINLESNRLTEESFKTNAFILNGRIATIRMAGNPNLQVLKKEVFLELLLTTGRYDKNETNILDVRGSPLLCNKKNLWILDEKAKLQKRIINAISADNGLDFWKHTYQSCNREAFGPQVNLWDRFE